MKSITIEVALPPEKDRTEPRKWGEQHRLTTLLEAYQREAKTLGISIKSPKRAFLEPAKDGGQGSPFLFSLFTGPLFASLARLYTSGIDWATDPSLENLTAPMSYRGFFPPQDGVYPPGNSLPWAITPGILQAGVPPVGFKEQSGKISRHSGQGEQKNIAKGRGGYYKGSGGVNPFWRRAFPSFPAENTQSPWGTTQFGFNRGAPMGPNAPFINLITTAEEITGLSPPYPQKPAGTGKTLAKSHFSSIPYSLRLPFALPRNTGSQHSPIMPNSFPGSAQKGFHNIYLPGFSPKGNNKKSGISGFQLLGNSPEPALATTPLYSGDHHIVNGCSFLDPAQHPNNRGNRQAERPRQGAFTGSYADKGNGTVLPGYNLNPPFVLPLGLPQNNRKTSCHPFWPENGKKEYLSRGENAFAWYEPTREQEHPPGTTTGFSHSGSRNKARATVHPALDQIKYHAPLPAFMASYHHTQYRPALFHRKPPAGDTRQGSPAKARPPALADLPPQYGNSSKNLPSKGNSITENERKTLRQAIVSPEDLSRRGQHSVSSLSRRDTGGGLKYLDDLISGISPLSVTSVTQLKGHRNFLDPVSGILSPSLQPVAFGQETAAMQPFPAASDKGPLSPDAPGETIIQVSYANNPVEIKLHTPEPDMEKALLENLPAIGNALAGLFEKEMRQAFLNQTLTRA